MRSNIAAGLVLAILVALATPALAGPAQDAVPGEPRVSRSTDYVIHRGQMERPGEQTMPAIVDLFSRVGVTFQAAVITAGIWVFEGPFNPSGAARAHDRHVTPRVHYAFRDPLGSH